MAHASELPISEWEKHFGEEAGRVEVGRAP